MNVVRGGAGAHRFSRGCGVLLVALRPGERLLARLAGAEGPGELDPVAARGSDLEAVEEKVVPFDAAGRGRVLELRAGRAFGAREHHVHRRAVGAEGREVPLGLSHYVGFGDADVVHRERGANAVLVQAEALAHRLELLLALHRAGGVEALVPRLGDLGERAMVAHRHHVVEPIDAEALPVARAFADPLTGVLGEDLVLDPRLGVVADPAGLLGEDDRRVALDGEDDVGVAPLDLRLARHPRSLIIHVAPRGTRGATQGEPLGSPEPPSPTAAQLRHAAVLALISAVSARFSGASTPYRSPKATTAPFRKSTSVDRKSVV